ncbi:MAG: hypothetical protein O8C66_14470 [Candidatus Methanoperedens sp.]|nr:hypothetical protein [Candidatus Methanoperedens sp.]MCZ7371705.1 hypothetical protein [Candidatus Methanoperedens sp.]
MSFTKILSRIIYFLKSQDAVSEVMDFVIFAGILILSLSIIGIAGYPVLKNTQKNILIENTKQSFILLAANINKIVLGQAPSQSMELKVDGGTVSVTGNSTINITAKNSTGQTITLVDQQMRSIQSSTEDTVIAYEGTGAWAKYPDGAVLNFYEPLLARQDNILFVPVVYVSGDSSAGGSGIINVKVKGVQSIAFYGNMSNITVTIASSYSDAWKDYFISKLKWDSCNPNECTARLNTPNVDVYILNIQMDTVIE